MLDLRKRELLHKTWSDRVYVPLRRKILDTMNGPDRSENYRRRQELYHQFLEHVNRKVSVTTVVEHFIMIISIGTLIIRKNSLLIIFS
jgi:hypothetical protein